MNINIQHRCSDFDSYRAARVKSLFNAESGCNFDLSAELPIDDNNWSLGVIVGPSGSGKSSLGAKIFPEGAAAIYQPTGWPDDAPIVDAIDPHGSFDNVTGALAAVGLGSVPAWLRPYSVLSNGERFRADLARVICEAPDRVVIDEFSSVVDRQIARFGALAFSKSWKRTARKPDGPPRQCVLLSCHYDILEWLEPDWIFDTATGNFTRRSLRRPSFELEIYETNWRHWPLFEPHYYLKLPKMIAATCYVGAVEGVPVCHMAVGTISGMRAARASRLAVLPEWQGAGVGLRFLNAVCDLWLRGENRYGLPLKTIFHTSHPGLCQALRRDPNWSQKDAQLYGKRKSQSIASLQKSTGNNGGTGFGGHFRATQAFHYIGEDAVREAIALKTNP